MPVAGIECRAERPRGIRAHTGARRFESDVRCNQHGGEVMAIRRQDLVIGREQDRAHEDKRDGQFGNKRDGVAVNIGYGGSVTTRVVRRRTLKHKRRERHASGGPVVRFTGWRWDTVTPCGIPAEPSFSSPARRRRNLPKLTRSARFGAASLQKPRVWLTDING